MLVDPTSGQADALPEAPFDRPLAHPIATRVGDDVVVIGSECLASEPVEGNAEFCEPDTYAAARFDLREHEWEQIAVPPELRSVEGGYRGSLGVLDDRAVLVLGREPPQVWTYAPAASQWAKAPGSVVSDQACLAGATLVERVPTQDQTRPSTVALRLTEFATGATRGSSPLPGVAYQPFIDGSLRCRDHEIVVVDPGGVGGASGVHGYDATTDTWSTFPPSPVDLFGFTSLWVGDELVFLPTPGRAGQPAFALDPTTGRWRPIPDPPTDPAGAVADGTTVAGYVGPSFEADDSAPVICAGSPAGVAPSPTPPSTSDRPECRPDYRPPEPRRFRAGVWSFTVPPA